MAASKTTFNLNTNKIILDDEDDYSGVVYPPGASAIGVNYTIVSPSGTTIHNGTSTTDYDCYPLTDTEFEKSLQTDADGNALQGTYTVTKKVYYVDGSGDFVAFWNEVESTIVLNFTAPTAVVTPTVDYYSPLLSATDETNYTVNGVTYNTIDRTLSIIPSNAISPPASTVTATGSYVSTSTFYGEEGGLEYTFKLEATLTYNFAATATSITYWVIQDIEDIETTDIEVPDDVCKVYCTLAALEQRYTNAKCSNEANVLLYRTPFLLGSAYAQLMRQAFLCGKPAKVATFKEAIYDLGNSNDDCSCCGSDGPELVQGLGGGAGTTIVQGVDGETVVTFDGSDTYTVGLDPDILDIINALAYDVTSDDGSIDVVETTEDGVTTFDLSISDDFASQRLDVEVSVLLSGAATPTVAIENQKLTGNVFQEVNQSGGTEFMVIDPNVTNLSEYLNTPVRFLLDNFIASAPDSFFVSCELTNAVSSTITDTYPITAEIQWHDDETAYLMLKRSDGNWITGAWLASSLVRTLYIKITFTS